MAPTSGALRSLRWLGDGWSLYSPLSCKMMIHTSVRAMTTMHSSEFNVCTPLTRMIETVFGRGAPELFRRSLQVSTSQKKPANIGQANDTNISTCHEDVCCRLKNCRNSLILQNHLECSECSATSSTRVIYLFVHANVAFENYIARDMKKVQMNLSGSR